MSTRTDNSNQFRKLLRHYEHKMENESKNVLKPMDSEQLREYGHRMVDFIADYYKTIESFPVLSQVQVKDEFWNIMERVRCLPGIDVGMQKIHGMVVEDYYDSNSHFAAEKVLDFWNDKIQIWMEIN